MWSLRLWKLIPLDTFLDTTSSVLQGLTHPLLKPPKAQVGKSGFRRRRQFLITQHRAGQRVCAN